MAIRGVGKLVTIAQLYEGLDEGFKAELDASSEATCLFRLLKVPKSTILRPLVEALLGKYDCEKCVFVFGLHHLNVTLEDVLFLTGLPIWGEPVISSNSRDEHAFTRVFAEQLKRTLSMEQLRAIAIDVTKDHRKRKIAVLLIIVSCFIIPSADGQRVDTTYVQFIENLDKVDSYAWGAALLAFLYSGIKKCKGVNTPKGAIDGNLWVLMSFFLIRIPKLQDAIGIELKLEDCTVPLMFGVVEEVRKISHNHKPSYMERVDEILHNLSEEEVLWSPYSSSVLPRPLQDQAQFGTLLAPLFCNNYVVHHRPHLVAKQFNVFKDRIPSSLRWKDYEIKVKQNRGPHKQNFKKIYEKELQIWGEKQLAQNLMRRVTQVRISRNTRWSIPHNDQHVTYSPEHHFDNHSTHANTSLGEPHPHESRPERLTQARDHIKKRRVNSYEDTNHENLRIEMNDESELRNWQRQIVSEIGSSTFQEQDEEHNAATTAKNVRIESKKISCSEKNDRNRKKRKAPDSNEFPCSSSSTESNNNDVSTSLRDSEVSSYGANQDMDIGVAKRTRSKMRSITKASEVGNVLLGSSTNSESSPTDGANQNMDTGIAKRTRSKMRSIRKASEVGNVLLGSSTNSESSPTGSGSDTSVNEDFEVESSNNDIELLSSHVEAREVREENEETDTTFQYDADPEEGLKERSKVKESTCSKQSNTKERTEVTGLVSHVRAKNKTADMANQKKVTTGAEEAAPLSHSNNGYNHRDDGTTKRTEAATTSDSHLHAKNKPAGMASEKTALTRPKEAAPPSYSKGVYDDNDDGTKGRTEAASLDPQDHAKTNNCADMANETEVLMRRKQVSPKQVKGNEVIFFGDNDVYDHNVDGNEERTEAASSDAHDHAKTDAAGMANEMEVPMRRKQVSLKQVKGNEVIIIGDNDVYDHNDDGTEERTEATSSDLLSHAKTDAADMTNETEVPMGRKQVSPKQVKGNEVIIFEDNDDGTDEKTKAVSSDSHDHAETEATDMDNETKVPTRRKQVSSKQQVKDLCSMLADAVLGNRLIPASQTQTQTTLPLKFRFEDEVPKQVEKTEYELEVDGLFSELDREWAFNEMQSFDYPKDNLENENSPPEETQHARCCRGKHELVLEDDEGLICIFCRYVELRPKDVMPQWVERTYKESERKRCHETEQLFEFDELHMHPSTNDDAEAGSTSYATGTVWSIKPGVRESMYEHQREGFEFLWKNLAGSIDLEDLKSTDPVGVGGCIISHAPGTGKTRLTIVFVETYFKMFPNCRPVIISPASTLLTWEEEFKKWNVEFPFHNLSNFELSGNENKTALELLPQTKIKEKEAIRMIKICSWSMGGSILGISYNLFEKLTGERNIKQMRNRKRKCHVGYNEKMRKILLEKPGLVVLDEGHTPRNSKSSIWNVLLKLKTEKRVILSGTPFQNNFGELFNTLRIVRPATADVLARKKMFAKTVMPKRMSSSRKREEEHPQSSLILEDMDHAVEYLKACMSPFVHLHRGAILQQSLPGLRDCVVLLKPHALQKSLIKRIESSNNFKFQHQVSLISVHPYLFLRCGTTKDQRVGVDMGAVGASKLNPQEGVKTRFLLELLRLSMAVKEKVLVFSQYIQPLELIKEQLQEVFKWVEGKEILHLQAKRNQKQRQILINLFNDPQSESKIMLAATKCCSEGISLVGASRVVLLDVVWNPSVERQAICRAYRIGQKKFVHTYHLMTSRTTEADKYCRQAEKERLSELVFSSSNESNQHKHASLGIEDRILEEMIARHSMKGMFEKIINQPKEIDLIQTFDLTS